jgi:hypothetical protein
MIVSISKSLLIFASGALVSAATICMLRKKDESNESFATTEGTNPKITIKVGKPIEIINDTDIEKDKESAVSGFCLDLNGDMYVIQSVSPIETGDDYIIFNINDTSNPKDDKDKMLDCCRKYITISNEFELVDARLKIIDTGEWWENAPIFKLTELQAYTIINVSFTKD